MPHRLAVPQIAVALLVCLALISCSADNEPLPNEAATSPSATVTPTESATDASPSEPPANEPEARIEIERENGKFNLSGERVKVKLGEPIILAITADAPGEFHVHSTPEQQISYGQGKSTREITIAQPGVVEMESHEPALVVLQFEVR